MYTPDLVDVPTEVFGGYCPAIPDSQVPPGAASIAEDVEFPLAGVRQRGGLADAFALSPIPANASINGLKTYITPALQNRLLIWDSLGDFFKEDPQGTINLVNSRPYAGLFYQSATLFGREYQAFFNGLGGFDIPRQYDDTNWDRVSQGGPGAAPTVADISWNIVSISRAATTGVITLTLAATEGVVEQYVTVGSLMTIDGVTADTTLEGTFPVQSIGTSGGQAVITLWGAPGYYSISSVQRASNVVTAVLAQTPTLTASEAIVVGDVDDDSYDGAFTVATIDGNTVTWDQTGPNSISAGGILYIKNFTASVYAGVSPGYLPDNTGNLAAFYLIGDQTSFFLPGATITCAGNSDSSYNANFTISTSVLPVFLAPGTSTLAGDSTGSQGLTVVYIESGPSGPSYGTGGTAVAALPASTPTASGVAGPFGNISAGLHNVSVAFVTRQGAILAGAPYSSWVAGGALTAEVSNIPTGPGNVVQRLLLFTPTIAAPATTGTFYSLPNGSTSLSQLAVMLIPDNSTRAMQIDFSDAILISGFQAEYLFSQLTLGESAFVIPYNSRLFWLGERAKVSNFVNLDFEGGDDESLLPDGWILDPNDFNETYCGLTNDGDWADCLEMFANPEEPATIIGKITQSAYKDYLQVPILQPATAYSVRARIALSGPVGTLTQGTLHVNLYSPTGGFTTAGLAVTAAQVNAAGSGVFVEYIATLTDTPLAEIPSDLVLQVYADGSPNGANISGFLIDSIEPFPTNTPFNSSTARGSRAFNPESYDSTTGQIQVRPGDGQQLRAGFPLRNNLYLAKDHYLCYVADDGVNEPASWPVNEVSSTVGICGPNAVDSMEEWAAFAERSGLYICWGSDPAKITPEIQKDASGTGKITWESINWAYAWTIWVRIDRINKKILVGAPVNGATSPNIVFVLDYAWLMSGEDIASAPSAGYSMFTNKPISHGGARRWALWNIAANSMCFAERNDGTAQPFWGNGVYNGLIYEQLDASLQPSDNGVPINSQYKGYGLPSSEQEQGLQLGVHRKLAGYLKWRAVGSGNLGFSISTAQRTTNLRPYQLSTDPAGDGERPLNLHGERFFTQVGACTTIAVRTAVMVEVGGGTLHNIVHAQFTLVAPHTFGFGDKFNYAGGSDSNFTRQWTVSAPQPNPQTVIAYATIALSEVELNETTLGGAISNFPLDPTAWWQLEKLAICIRKDATAVVRGMSS